ncbi:MAG: hypothetical protein HC837_01960 [Chloroflexaceae bacterium]|nr:hypothetical protein [Chloroflexaceae bacterium]
MQRDSGSMQKADQFLQEALRNAQNDQVLRAVMVINDQDEPVTQESVCPPSDPSHYHSRKEYRQALIQRQQESMYLAHDDTLQALRDLKLAPRGGHIGHSVVVEGTASQLIRSLDLPGVLHASLDQAILLTYTDPNSTTE